eukprot:UN01493
MGLLFFIAVGIVLGSYSQIEGAGGNATEQIFGVGMAVAATLCYGLSFVMIETKIKIHEETASKQHVAAFAMGCSTLPVSLLYFLVVVVPFFWKDWITQPIKRRRYR